MADWFERTLSILTPDTELPVLVIDPDGLLKFPQVEKGCVDQGFTVFTAEPGFEVRLLFETKLRSKNKMMLAVPGDYKPLPDITLASQVVQVSFGLLFPFLDAKALRGLGFNALCLLDTVRPYTNLGYESTLRFLLENLYNVDLEALKNNKTRERVLAVCLKTVFHPDEPNPPIRRFLAQLAKPLFEAASEKLAFRDSLKEYLAGEWAKSRKGESRLDFSDSLLNPAVNALFISGQLPLQLLARGEYELLPASLRPGFRYDEEDAGRKRAGELNAYLEESVKGIQNQQQDWFALAPIIGEMGALVYSLNEPELVETFRTRMAELNRRFQSFVQYCYWSLHSLSGVRYPNVIPKVLDYLNAQSSERKALIVLDGMNLWQWHIIKEALSGVNLPARDIPTFSWLPSITAWSRQALLKGSKPDLKKNNSGEEKLFRDYWIGKNIPASQIGFGIFKAGISPDIPEPDIRAAAYVCNDLDSLMHGTLLGNRELFLDTREWVKSSGILYFIEELAGKGFSVYIATDHGSLEAEAWGSLPAGIRNLSLSRSKRHLYFTEETKAEEFVKNHPDLAARQSGRSIYLTGNQAFTGSGKIITHGGSHLLEILIPLGAVK